MKKSFFLALGFVFFSILNQTVDFYIASSRWFFAFWLSIYMHSSPSFVFRGVAFNLMNTYRGDWILDISIVVLFYTLVFKAISSVFK